MEEIAQKTFIDSKMTQFSKVSKMAIFKHFAKAISNKAKFSKMADFVGAIEIDKIRNTAEIFPFMANFLFYGLLNSFWINCMEEQLKNFF